MADLSLLHQVIQDISIVIAILIGLKSLLPKSSQQDVALLQAELKFLNERLSNHEQNDKDGMQVLSNKLDKIQEYLLQHKG